MKARALHRWLGLGLVAPFVVWAVTGLLFHLKPGWARAYDMLSAERAEAVLGGEAGAALVSAQAAAAAAATAGPAQATRVELFATALGPLWRVRGDDGATVLVDARSGAVRSPLGEADARLLAEDAVARSPHRAAYGEVRGVEVAGTEVRVRFAGGPVVSVERASARLGQEGADTRRIDWLYRMHYLQWTGVRGVDRVVAVVGLVGIVLLAGLGVALVVRRTRAA